MKLKFSLIFLFFVLNLVLFSQDLHIISSDQTSIVFEYKPVISDTIQKSINGKNYIFYSIPGTVIDNLQEFGMPSVQSKVFNIGVPSEFGNTIQILSSSYKTINGNYLPNPRYEKDSSIFVEKPYVSDNYYSAVEKELVSFGDYGLVRSLPVQTIKIFPLHFNPTTQNILVYDKIVFKINFGTATTKKVKIIEDYISNLVLNWDVAKNWGEEVTKLSKISNSVLADGTWYRFEVADEGIYKIDRTFLQNLGIDVNTVDPRTIKIYNNGGYSLNEDYNTYKNNGLVENAILFVGESDGVIDASDYILFYGRTPEFWEYNSKQKKILRSKNPFSKKNYYWLTFGGIAGKRMTEKPSLNLQSVTKQTISYGFKSYDKDSINIKQTGREYFGDAIDANTKSRTLINTLNGWVPGTSINYNLRVINASNVYVPFTVEESGSQLYSTTIYKADPNFNDYAIEDISNFSFKGTLTDERSVAKFSISTSSVSAKVYLDYFEISFSRYLRAVSDNFTLFAKDTTANLEYSVTNFSTSTIQAFDVTDYSNVNVVSNAVTSGGQITFQSAEVKNSPSKYLIVSSNGFKTPTGGTKIDNSNIRGNVAGSEMIVIAPKDFKTQALRYATYRSSESPNPLTTQVFYVDEVFNEFSCGMMDPFAIRDFLKYAYENWQTKPFYVLLFGDGSFDYLNTVSNNNNFIPTWESENSISETDSYNSDDYFVRVSGFDIKPDFAIGRLTVQTTKEADIAVEKIINYETVQSKGDWRNTITLVADDGPAGTGSNDYAMHTSQSENLALRILPRFLYQKKIYLVAYPTVYVGLGRRKPDVNKAIIDAVNDGTVLLNYVGHGSPELWAHENVFVKTTTIPQLKNENYFFLTAATCDFGLWDDPKIQSSAEELMNLEGAGAILSFTASRVVYSSYNGPLNDSLYTNLFRKRDSNYLPIRVGNAYFLTKQYVISRVNDEKYHLFGDPAIRLNLPVLPVTVDSVNGKTADQTVQMSALSEGRIKGSVKKSDGSNNTVNGEINLSVFDSDRSIYYQEMDYTVKQQGGLIFKGRGTVTDGKFDVSFIVPKDISYENKYGKIVAYFSNAQNDGVGFTSNFTVGGTNANAVDDKKGPEIEIFFDNTNFEGSYLVNPNFQLIAKLKDETGLNTTGTGIGHKLEAVLNDDVTNSIDLTNNFVGDLNSGGKSGVAKYNFSNLEPGDYKIKVKAWDVFNNFSSQEVPFTVVSADKGIVIRDVVNYPNPFTSNTTFTFQHNYSSTINTKIKIYTVAGRLIKTIESFDILDKFVRIDWDGRDEDGNQIANGTYLYKVIVESVDGQFRDSILGKLSIIR